MKSNKKSPGGGDADRRIKAFELKHKKAVALFGNILDMYHLNACPCAYPRFLQITGIDCAGLGHAFKCFDTELLIALSKSYFDIRKSALSDENTNEKWVCKTCGSTYEYGWQDFSIAVDRQKLKLTDLKAHEIGKEIANPVPLYLGLMGHSYPQESEMTMVGFEAFEKYMKEN